MTGARKRIIAMLGTVVVCFLSAAFITWDIFPANWDVATRALFIAGTMMVLSFVSAFSFKDDLP